MTTISLERPWGAIAATDQGRGDDVVVLVHPLASSAAIWGPVVDVLAQSRRVIAVDARGHGESTWDGSAFTIDDLADDLAAVIEQAGVAGALVAGMSMGGCTTIALGCRRPDLVGGLLLVDTTADYGPDKAAKWSARAEAALTPRREQLPFQVDRWFTREFREQRPDEVERVCEIFVATDSRAHAQACRALGAFDRSGDLASLPPASIVVGEQDEATPPAMSRRLADGIPDSILTVLPGRAHLGFLEVPERWGPSFDLAASLRPMNGTK
jgi:3-oxoadipate enol-lactonase